MLDVNHGISGQDIDGTGNEPGNIIGGAGNDTLEGDAEYYQYQPGYASLDATPETSADDTLDGGAGDIAGNAILFWQAKYRMQAANDADMPDWLAKTAA